MGMHLILSTASNSGLQHKIVSLATTSTPPTNSLEVTLDLLCRKTIWRDTPLRWWKELWKRAHYWLVITSLKRSIVHKESTQENSYQVAQSAFVVLQAGPKYTYSKLGEWTWWLKIFPSHNSYPWHPKLQKYCTRKCFRKTKIAHG